MTSDKTVQVDDAGRGYNKITLTIDGDGDIEFSGSDEYAEIWIKPAALVAALKELGVLPDDADKPSERRWRHPALTALQQALNTAREQDERAAQSRQWGSRTEVEGPYSWCQPSWQTREGQATYVARLREQAQRDMRDISRSVWGQFQ